MNIIILTEKDKTDDGIYSIGDDRFTHIRNILKSEVGEIIKIGFLNGPIGQAEIIHIGNEALKIKILKTNELNLLEPQIHIILALPRPQTLKKVLNTIATMGVHQLHLIRSAKVEKSYFHSPLLEKRNMTKYLIEGLSQGKRTKLPDVTIHYKFKQFFENNYTDKGEEHLKLLAHADVDNYLSIDKKNIIKKITIAIGPEGGWNEFESNFMLQKGFKSFKLSESILRVENAVTASLAQLELILSR